MPSYENREGVWMLYDYDGRPYIMQIAIDVVPLTRRAAQDGFGKVGFWPYGMEFHDAVKWWEARDRTDILTNSIVHFFYEEPSGLPPLCEDIEREAWVMFDSTHPGKICSLCQTKLGRTIS
jgi:hypothetical protein